MELRYTLSLDDYVNLNKYSPQKKKNDLKILLTLFIFFFFITILGYLVNFSLGNECAILSIIFYITIIIFKNLILKTAIKKKILTFPYMLDDIILKFNNDSIIFKYDCDYVSPIKFNLNIISEIHECEDYLYVFSNKNNILFFIPLKSLSEDDKNKFLNLF